MVPTSNIILPIKFIRVKQEMTVDAERTSRIFACPAIHVSALQTATLLLHTRLAREIWIVENGNRYAVSCVVKRRYINAKFKRNGNMRSNV